MTELELVEAMGQIFQPKAWSHGCSHLPLGDSKQLYQSGSGIGSLETGLLAMLCQSGPEQQAASDVESIPENFCKLLRQVGDPLCFATDTAKAPWYENLEHIPVPVAANGTEILRLGQRAVKHLEACGIRFVGLTSRVVPEAEFNDLVEQLNSKGLVLSRLTLGLVSQIISDCRLPAEIFCDRQGGRKNYLPVLADTFPDYWFQEMRVSAERCSYRNTDPAIDIHFSVGGDSFPPTALASMLAKYLRERIMESFNSYWLKHVPGLKPTAGYPQDAKRFRTDVAEAVERSRLAEHTWWRCR